MSERTTIGGVTYEAVGSSSSNLLLKCNGTARIQWGNKLIDLIKNGKLVSSAASAEQIFIVTDESQIKSDGIYVIDSDETSQLWISKDGKQYNLSGTELYISTSNQQNITAEQKQQAIENIGLYYNTLEDAQNAGVQNGLVYIISTKKLYTVFNGVYEEFQAQLKTIAVEEKQEQDIKGEVINSSIKIVLSISGIEYLILSDNKIYSNYPIYVDDSAQICSKHQKYRMYVENGLGYVVADNISANNEVKAKTVTTTTAISPNIVSDETETPGFKLYTQEDVSYLDIDYINAREWTPFVRGMIMMFNGQSDIPEGWAICDGQTHTYKGVTTVTPNLIGKFIKASDSSGAGTEGGSNEVTLTSDNLPEHSHPHNVHSHSISGTSITIDSSGSLSMTSSTQFVERVSSNTDVVSDNSDDTVTVISGITPTYKTINTTGGSHTHTVTITEGTISNSESTEQEKQWANTSINIEPEYYTLIFIIKL